MEPNSATNLYNDGVFGFAVKASKVEGESS